MPRFLYLLSFLIFTPLLSQPANGNEESPSINHNSVTTAFDADTSLNFWGHFSKMILALCFILALVYLASWILKKTVATRIESLNKQKKIKIIETRSLNPKNHIHLIEVEGHHLLIGESPSGLHTLSPLPQNFANLMENPPHA